MTKKISSRTRKEPSYNSYVVKILKKRHPNLGISSNAVLSTNGVLEHLLSRMLQASKTTAKIGKKATLSSRHVQAATNVVLTPAMAKHAVVEGARAITKFKM